MMHSTSAEVNLLSLLFQMLCKFFRCKDTIVTMILFNSHSMLGSPSFEQFLCYNGFACLQRDLVSEKDNSTHVVNNQCATTVFVVLFLFSMSVW